LAVGIALYLLYVVKVGGDFMSGRFFTAPLVMAVCMVVQIDVSPRPILWGIAQLGALFLALIAPGSPILSGENYHSIRTGFGPNDHGIADERGYYYPFAGLLPTWRWHGGEPTHGWVNQGRDAKARGMKVVVKGNVGYFGFYAGRDVYIVDPGALTDPLLARLPAVHTPHWRIGHFTRVIPEGYPETLQSGDNRLADKRLAEYRDKLAFVVSGPLFDKNRLLEIWRINTGAYDHLIDHEAYRAAPPLIRRYSELPHEKPPEKGLYFGLNGIEVDLEGRALPDQLEISLDNDDKYDIVFLRGDVELERTSVEPQEFALAVGLNVYSVNVPYAARQAGCDQLRIVPVPLANDGSFNIGHIRIVESSP
jgi:arabinofuranosyltransferase